jgi:uncharacterized RDD family membrane protein YckC
MSAKSGGVTLPAHALDLQGRRAGVVTRLAAGAIDLAVAILIIAALYGGIAGLAFLIRPSSFHWPRGLRWTTLPAIGFLVLTPYLAMSWATTGRTYGDAVLGLRVVVTGGGRLGVTRAILRAAGCVAFPLGLLWSAVSRTNRSVQDLIFGTSVVYDWTVRADLV